MDIASVVNRNECMICGECSAICPQKAIKMEYHTNEGRYFPEIDEKTCIQCGKCVQCCPSVVQSNDGLMGEYRRIFLAHSANIEVRYGATSGGVINSLARFLLNEKIVDGVLMVQYDKASMIEASPVWITDSNAELLEAHPRDFASRYVSVPVLSGMQKMPAGVKRIAVVGTPCQTQALHLAERFSGVYVFKIGIACSGGMSYLATEEYKRAQKAQNADIYYRGNGWPGKNSLLLGERTVEYGHSGSYFERMFSSQIFKNPGCHICKDHFAETADISFCDFWNKQEMKQEKIGNSCVILRSAKAEEIFDRMTQAGFVVTVKSLTQQDVTSTQMHVLKAKKGTLRLDPRYRLFRYCTTFIFHYKLYRFFSYRTYRRICGFYSRICKNSHL